MKLKIKGVSVDKEVNPFVEAKKKKLGAHPGFKKVSASIAAKEGIPAKNAAAILAASSRGASKKAKQKNKNLLKIKGRKV